MAKRSESLFDVDSDDDSINTTTTAGSEVDQDRDYDVEKILSEHIGEDGQVKYLLKWAGYPLHRCTWETTEYITSQILFRDWDKQKRAIKRKEVEPFDVQQWYDAVEAAQADVDEKKRRRIAKRRKRGEVVESTEEGEWSNGDDESPMQPKSPKRTRAKVQPVKRKGVTLPVSKKTSKVVSPSAVEDNIEVHGDSSSSEEPISNQRPKKTKPADASSVLKTTNRKPSATKAVPTESTSEPPLLNKPSNRVPTPAKEAEAAVKPVFSSTTAARKSVPAVASKTATNRPASTSKVFGGDWTVDKKKSKQRAWVSGETPKDSTGPKFSNLSTQNRYQKYGQNEPAPDVNAIRIVDPKTGRVEPPNNAQPTRQLSASANTGPSAIHSAYGRRTPPPTDARAKSPSSPPRPGQQPPTMNRGPVPVMSTNVDNSTVPAETLPSATGFHGTSSKDIVCMYWQAGNCRYTADMCPYAHAYGPDKSLSKKATTCYFWKNRGTCIYTDAECAFAHYDTRLYAGQPGSFKKRTSSAPAIAAIRASDLQAMRSESSVGDAQMFEDVPDQPAEPPQLPANIAKESEDVFRRIVVGDSIVATGELDQPVTSPTNEASTKNIHITNLAGPNLTEKVSAPDTVTVSPAKGPRLRPQLTAAVDSAMELSTTVGTMPEADRSVEADLAMAMKSITSLDSSRLLKYGEGQIENVYIHMPDERTGELHLLRKYFIKFNCKVFYTPNDVDHWKYFRETFEKSCLLVFHPSETFIDTIPGLHKYLMTKGNIARVFSIGVQHDQCILEMRGPAYEARRLFPNGGITFITDDVFAYYPDKATEIIQAFLTENETKPVGAQSSKIGARPGIKEWMVQLAMRKFEEGGGEGQTTDMRWVECYDALCRLCPLEDEDLEFPDHSVPLETSNLWSVWEESLPSLKGRWESGDEEGATDYMANHFAGEACDKAWQYRKFLFVYQRPGTEKETVNSQGATIVKPEVDPKGWEKKYCHIGVVTPEQALRSMRGGKKARPDE